MRFVIVLMLMAACGEAPVETLDASVDTQDGSSDLCSGINCGENGHCVVERSGSYPVPHPVCNCAMGFGPVCCDGAGVCSYTPHTCPLQWGATSTCERWTTDGGTAWDAGQ